MTAISFERVHDRIYRLAAPFEGGGLTNMYLVRGSKTAVIDTAVLGAPTELPGAGPGGDRARAGRRSTTC